jgi:cytochrome oxidase Cu insertion factor (SCO1/SenC/PrrC family)
MRICFLLGFLFLSINQLCVAAKISGTFLGAPAGDRFTVRVAKQYIDGQALNYELNTNHDGQWTTEVALSEAQYVTLQHNNEILMMYVEPNDKLEVMADIFTFPLKVNYAGTGAENNRCLQGFLRTFPINFNEFSKTRFKIANYWVAIEPELDETMRRTAPADFATYLEARQKKHLDFVDAWDLTYPNGLSSGFKQFISAEIMYRNGYESIVYANVYKNWHNVTDTWLDAAIQLPLDAEMIGSEFYRKFLMAYMANRCKKSGKPRMIESQFLDGGLTLVNKPRAFFQSEIIYNALREEQYAEVMPYYSNFLKENALDAYEQKITDVYEKFVAFAQGSTAPSFAGVDQSGKKVNLQDLRGKIIYLNFWASYCGTCIKKIEYMNTRFGELDRQGVKVINVSLDQDKDIWQSNLSIYNVVGINLMSGGEGTTNLTQDFRVEAVPQYYIIDKNGMFVQKPVSSKPEDIVQFLLERGTN